VLEPESEDTFYTNAIDGPVRFERDEAGHIVAMQMLRWPGRFLRVDFTDRAPPSGLAQACPRPDPDLTQT